jgi:intein/homing endonuclease
MYYTFDTKNPFYDLIVSKLPIEEQIVHVAMRNPAFACKYIFNTEIFAFQNLMFKIFAEKPFPLLVANRGYGKCVTGDTNLVTNSGFVKISEIVGDCDVMVKKKHDNLLLHGENGYKKVKYSWNNGVSDTLKIVTRSGFQIEGTYNHPVRVVRSGKLEWIDLKDVVVGDRLPIIRDDTWFDETNKLTQDEAYLFGLLVGDGGYTVRGSVSFTNKDTFLVSEAMRLSKKVFGKSFVDVSSAPYGHKLYGTDIWDSLFNKYGFNSSVCGEKDFPTSVLSAPKRSMISFIQGLFDTDGYVGVAEIGITMKSENIIRRLQYILTFFGIISNVRIRYNKKYETSYFCLSMFGKNARLFLSKIGFRLKRKQTIGVLRLSKKTNSNTDTIPNNLIKDVVLKIRNRYAEICRHKIRSAGNIKDYECTYEFLQKILKTAISCNKNNVCSDSEIKYIQSIMHKHYFYDTVKKISASKNKTYDVNIPKDHSFNSNGFISHNSFALAVHAVLTALFNQGSKTILVARNYRQCVDGKSLLFSDNGIIRMRDVSVGYVVADGDSVNKVRHHWEVAEQQTTTITTNNGYFIHGADNHKVLKNGFWSTLSHTEVGDAVQIFYGQDLFSKKDVDLLPMGFNRVSVQDKRLQLPKSVDKDLAWILGKIFSKRASEDNGTIRFNIKDATTRDRYYRKVSSIFNYKVIREYKKKRRSFYAGKIINKNICNFLRENGIDLTRRMLPSCILMSKKETVCSFISSLIEESVSIDRLRKSIVFRHWSNPLLKDVQIVLLNFGIISNRAYDRIEIKGLSNIANFAKNFTIKGQENNNKLNTILSKSDDRVGHDILVFDDRIRFILTHNKVNVDEWRGEAIDGFIPVKKLKDIADKYNLSSVLVDYILPNCFCDKVISIEKSLGITYDVEIDESSRYFANGFINHNSQLVFDYITTIYNKSEILQNITNKPPTKATSSCLFTIGDSYIKAIPLGDGSGVRGERATNILVDEYPFVPEDVFQTVIRGFAAVSGDPVQRVRMKARINEYIRKGLPVPKELRLSSNQILLTGTAYYEDNHFTKTYYKYRNLIDNKYCGSVGDVDQSVAGNEYVDYKDYAVLHFDYTMLPDGYMEEKQISQAKLTMSESAFAMEYMSKFQSNSQGFYKHSDVQKCESAGTDRYVVEVRGNPACQYVLGIDPSSGGVAEFGVCIMKITNEFKPVVFAKGMEKYTFPEALEEIKRLLRMFNIVKICMDSQGGGFTVRDLLRDSRIMGSYPLIFESASENKTATGRYILELVNPTSAWNLKANQDMQSDLHHRRVLFPAYGYVSNDPTEIREAEDAEDEMRKMRMQLESIELSMTKNGFSHFDVPSRKISEGDAKRIIRMRKDLFSALLLANYAANQMLTTPLTQSIYSNPDNFGGWASEFTGRNG